MDIVTRARDYLAANAAESGADVLIAELADEVGRLRADLALLGPVTAGVNVSQCRKCYAECADEWKHCPSCGAQERFPDKMVLHRE